MNRRTSSARYSIAVASIALLIVTTVARSPPTQARTVLETGYIQDCFCPWIHSSLEYFAFGLLNVNRDEDWGRVTSRELIVFWAIGPDAPETGTLVMFGNDVDSFVESKSGLHICIKHIVNQNPGPGAARLRCTGVETPSDVRYFGDGIDDVRGDIPLDRLCTQPRDIYDILRFFDDIHLDRARCNAEIVDALDLVDPFQPLPEPEGCNSGNPLGLLWPTAGLVLLARRRRTPPPV